MLKVNNEGGEPPSSLYGAVAKTKGIAHKEKKISDWNFADFRRYIIDTLRQSGKDNSVVFTKLNFSSLLNKIGNEEFKDFVDHIIFDSDWIEMIYPGHFNSVKMLDRFRQDRGKVNKKESKYGTLDLEKQDYNSTNEEVF